MLAVDWFIVNFPLCHFIIQYVVKNLSIGTGLNVYHISQTGSKQYDQPGARAVKLCAMDGGRQGCEFDG